MKSVAVVGAGFSGLTLARYLKKQGFEVEVFESQRSAGGLIHTTQEQMLIESAAHALMASQNVETLFQELGVEIVHSGYRSKSKWIFREKPRRLPLKLAELLPVFKFIFQKKLDPRPYQLLHDWIRENFNEGFWDYLVSPALQGVYGTRGEDLSATLILESFKLKSKIRIHRGSIAPKAGMGELVEKLSRGLQIHYSSSTTLLDLQNRFDSVVLALSCRQAGDYLNSVAPRLAQALCTLPMVTLTSVTIGSSHLKRKIRGFGCLFPEKEKFHSLGVIFNTDLFPGRGPLESETWIFQGELENVLEKIHLDRIKMGAQKIEIETSKVFSWPKALPLYGLELEKLLKSRLIDEAQVAESEKPIYLTGNYLGRIGLSKILDYNFKLAQMIKDKL